MAVALAGVSRSHAEATASRLASEILGLHLRDDVVERLRWHKANEHRVVVVSASFDAYVRPVAEHLGADAVLATRWDVDTCSGLLTGGLDGPNVRGHEKALRLQDWCNGGSRVGFAYGDSPGDAEMLAMADHPTLVTRSPMTRAPHY